MATQINRTFATRIDIPEAVCLKLVEIVERARGRRVRSLHAAETSALEREGQRLHPAARARRRHSGARARARRRDSRAGDNARWCCARHGRMAASASTLDEYPLETVAGIDTSRRSLTVSPPTAPPPARRSRRRSALMIKAPPPTCSSRCHARSTSTSGSPRHTCKPKREIAPVGCAHPLPGRRHSPLRQHERASSARRSPPSSSARVMYLIHRIP
jgi:hypothetical protein